jgi:hypothetical protein
MRILSDRHHMGLTESLRLLFEKRLGHELYFQKGMEWYPEFWNLQPFKDTAIQYLERELEGVNGVTLDEFKNTKFDILIASIPQHIEPFKKLIELYQPQAKLIYQIGNQWNVDPNVVKNIMASANIDIPAGVNGVIYHQEFDLDIFHYEPPKQGKKIYSFINCLNTVDLYRKDWELFLELERLMPDWEFKSFGGQCRNGAIWDRKELADKMREATFIFQCKTDGDGYGHNIFSAAAVGRPLITRRSDYIGKLAEPLVGSYSIKVDIYSPEEIAKHIQQVHSAWDMQHELILEDMSLGIYGKFNEVCDFDSEEQKIRTFLQNLQ